MSADSFKRKLTAVMSADVAGYSRLMGEDETQTVKTLTAYRKIIGDLIHQHRGRVVDSPGDNILSEFASVVDAVQCGVAVQNELKSRNADLPENHRMQFRIGINLGDVIEEEGRIYGDGVNIAARLESLAEPGCISISGLVYSQVKNKVSLEYEYLGEKSVKNINDSVAVYKVTSSPRVVATEVDGSPRIDSTRPSIAVLPFVNMSNDREQEYFSDGITEELINGLAKLKELKVISRTSVFCFKGKDVDLRTIGKKLNVQNVLEGSVRKAGNKLRISAQLIKVDDDTHVWAETFDRELKDVFAIQEDIAQAVVSKLELQLFGKKDRKPVQISIESQLSHDFYLKGLSSWNKRGPKQAIEHLEQSIALDSRNAPAYALLATVYTFITLTSPYPPRVSYAKAKAMALKALELDDKLADAHVAIAVVKMAYEYDWTGSEQALLQAIRLSPGLCSAHHYYAWHKLSVGKIDEAISEMRHALELDPLSTFAISFMGLSLIANGQYDQAVEYCRRALEMTPNDPGAMANLGFAYAKKGMSEESIAILEEGADLFPENPFLVSALGYSYGITGKREEAQKIVDGFIDISRKRYFSPMFISRVYAGMGEVDKAIEWLENAYEERDPSFSLVRSVPSHDYMRGDPRFRALLKKMGLGQE